MVSLNGSATPGILTWSGILSSSGWGTFLFTNLYFNTNNAGNIEAKPELSF